MKCRGNFKYRGLTKTDAGSFINDNGEKIDYKASYKLKVDEMTNLGIQERVFKIAIDSVLLPQITKLEPYTDISIDFEVQIFGNTCRLIPITIAPLK